MKQVSVSVQSIMQQELAAWLTCLLDKFQAGLAAERRPAAATDPPLAGLLVWHAGRAGVSVATAGWLAAGG